MEVEPSQVELVRAYLRDRTVGCPRCRYNLRGVTGGSCPECGAGLQLRLSTADARLGPWLVCVMAIALPLGFFAIAGLIGAYGALRREPWWTSGDSTLAGALWAVTAVYAAALAVMVARRGRFMRRSVLEQRVRAVAVALVAGALQAASLLLFQRIIPPWY